MWIEVDLLGPSTSSIRHKNVYVRIIEVTPNCDPSILKSNWGGRR